jgi:hypothetical protein
MEIDLTQVALLLGAKVQAFFEHSFLWSALKFFLFVYTLVLFVDVMILMIMKGFSSDLKSALYGTQRPLISQTKLIKRWEAILERLESDNPSQYKVAVLEADALANEILAGIGYGGSNMAEQLEAVQGGQLETKTLLMEAHEARNQIIHDPNFVLSKEEAKRYLDNFKQFFDEVELF